MFSSAKLLAVKLVSRIPLNIATRVLVVVPIFIILFQSLILLGILPFDIVWGGKLTPATVVPMVSFAIILNVLVLAIGLVKGGWVSQSVVVQVTRNVSWFMFYFLLCNTVLNLFSETLFEVIVFTPIVALVTVCLFRVLVSKEDLSIAESGKSP